MKSNLILSTVAALALSSFAANAETLRLLTWGGYAPDDVVATLSK
jgi:spermidine/putrescine transport system substrate-binding protein